MPTWEASLRGWLAAIECEEPQQEPEVHRSLRTARQRQKNRVTFDGSVEVYFYAYQGSVGGHVEMREIELRRWMGKPWALRPKSSSRSCRSRDACQDEVSWMQVGKPTMMRSDADAPGWAISMAQHHHEPPPDEQQSESVESENSREGGSPDGTHDERSGNGNQLDETLQSVLLYHLDDPVVHGHALDAH